MIRQVRLFTSLVFLALAGIAVADVITLEGGDRIDGEVVASDDQSLFVRVVGR
ncbi:MAG: hypothetical protein MK089_05300 [Phycisphaerales bacterium]|nr:hypothetical protein [Phycisphaerales bacterium]